MNYGNTFEEVRSRLKQPEKIETGYGACIFAIREPEFLLTQFCINKNSVLEVELSSGSLFIEKGSVSLPSYDGLTLCEKNITEIPSLRYLKLSSNKESIVYFFGKPDLIQETPAFTIKETFDFRDKYWGSIESIVSKDYVAKRIFMKEGKQSSLEYHCYKKEAYFLQSGRLKVGLRVGRAENRSIILESGDTFVISPGVMHMRIALKDSVIMEVSTKDDDMDSHLVEDGKTYFHKETSVQ